MLGVPLRDLLDYFHDLLLDLSPHGRLTSEGLFLLLWLKVLLRVLILIMMTLVLALVMALVLTLISVEMTLF